MKLFTPLDKKVIYFLCSAPSHREVPRRIGSQEVMQGRLGVLILTDFEDNQIPMYLLIRYGK
jgi:hypothetical protein